MLQSKALFCSISTKQENNTKNPLQIHMITTNTDEKQYNGIIVNYNS